MTPERLKEIREEMRLNQTELASLIGYKSSNKISAFENGREKIPRAVALILELRAEIYRAADGYGRIADRLAAFLRDHESGLCDSAAHELWQITTWVKQGAPAATAQRD